MICIDTHGGTSHHVTERDAAHLVSDRPGREGTEELIRFGRRIGLRVRWIQFRGQPKEHFDVFGPQIQRALDAGAKEVGMHGITEIIQRKREAS